MIDPSHVRIRSTTTYSHRDTSSCGSDDECGAALEMMIGGGLKSRGDLPGAAEDDDDDDDDDDEDNEEDEDDKVEETEAAAVVPEIEPFPSETPSPASPPLPSAPSSAAPSVQGPVGAPRPRARQRRQNQSSSGMAGIP